MARGRGADLVVLLVVGTLLALTLVILLDADVAPALVNAPLDVVLNASATLVALAVSMLAWIHFREGGEPPALWRSSAFLVLSVQNMFLIGIVVAGEADALGLSLDAPGQLPIWLVITGRGLAATLLLIGGVVALRRRQPVGIRPVAVLVLPAVILAAASVGMMLAADRLPTLLGADGLAQLRDDPTAPLAGEASLLLISLQLAIGLALLVTAGLSYRTYRRDGRDPELYLSIGFVIAAFSQVNSAIHPGSYASLVTTGDLLRVAFYAVLLLVVAAETRADVRALREANQELTRLRDADVERATAAERARLAREIHDGMSQELWYAKLKQGRLAALDDLPPEGRELADEVSGAIESALSEARQAILALRPAEGDSFSQALLRYVEDFSDRFGIPAECTVDAAGELLPTRHQAELLRIVHESLTNVRRHADATRVRVNVEREEGTLILTVSDNGRGFSTPDAPDSRYGLRSMRERAGIIGGELRIESAPQDGTRVRVQLPLPLGTNP